MNGSKYTLQSLNRRKGSSILLCALAFVIAAFTMMSIIIVDACQIYRARNENPYTDYYRVVVERRSGGVSSIENMSFGIMGTAKLVADYFLDIDDYTLEVTEVVEAKIDPCAKDWFYRKDQFMLYGISDCMAMHKFAKGEYTLEDGRFLNRDDDLSRRNLCMVSKDVAELNDIGVGDSIDIKIRDNDYKAFEIVGIYGVSIPLSTVSIGYSYEMPENQIFVPTCILEDSEYSRCNNFQIKLGNDALAYEVEALINEYKLHGGTAARLIKVSELYEGNNHGIRALERIFTAVQYGGIILAAFLMFLFVYSSVTSRRREIGVLLAIGKRPYSVVLSLLLELAVVIFAGTAIAVLVIYLFGRDAADILITYAQGNVSVEALASTTSDTLMLTENESEAMRVLMGDYDIFGNCVIPSAAFLLPVFCIGFVSAAIGVMKLQIIKLLTKQEGQ